MAMLRQMMGSIRQLAVQDALKELANDGHDVARLQMPQGQRDMCIASQMKPLI